MGIHFLQFTTKINLIRAKISLIYFKNLLNNKYNGIVINKCIFNKKRYIKILNLKFLDKS